MNENEKIKQIRKSLNLTQQEIADSIGVSKQYFSRVENGITELSKEKATMLCNNYGISLDWLLCDKGGMFINDNTITNNLLNDPDNIQGVSSILGAFSTYLEAVFPIIESEHPKALIRDKIRATQELFFNDLFKSDRVLKTCKELKSILEKDFANKDKVLNAYYKAYVERCEKNN